MVSKTGVLYERYGGTWVDSTTDCSGEQYPIESECSKQAAVGIPICSVGYEVCNEVVLSKLRATLWLDLQWLR